MILLLQEKPHWISDSSKSQHDIITNSINNSNRSMSGIVMTIVIISSVKFLSYHLQDH